jgi:hypothetical protein
MKDNGDDKTCGGYRQRHPLDMPSGARAPPPVKAPGTTHSSAIARRYQGGRSNDISRPQGNVIARQWLRL